MLSLKSSAMKRNTEALPIAMATPTTNSRAVNARGPRPICRSMAPSTVLTLIVVCGYDRMKKQTQQTNMTHHVAL